MLTALDYAIVARYLIYIGYDEGIAEAFRVTDLRDVFMSSRRKTLR